MSGIEIFIAADTRELAEGTVVPEGRTVRAQRLRGEAVRVRNAGRRALVVCVTEDGTACGLAIEATKGDAS